LPDPKILSLLCNILPTFCSIFFIVVFEFLLLFFGQLLPVVEELNVCHDSIAKPCSGPTDGVGAAEATDPQED
jgi:hypothetical protein